MVLSDELQSFIRYKQLQIMPIRRCHRSLENSSWPAFRRLHLLVHVTIQVECSININYLKRHFISSFFDFVNGPFYIFLFNIFRLSEVPSKSSSAQDRFDCIYFNVYNIQQSWVRNLFQRIKTKKQIILTKIIPIIRSTQICSCCNDNLYLC